MGDPDAKLRKARRAVAAQVQTMAGAHAVAVQVELEVERAVAAERARHTADAAADAAALAATHRDLARLRWAVRHRRDAATLRAVTPEALEDWLAAAGWSAVGDRVRDGAVVAREWGCAEHGQDTHCVVVLLRTDWADYVARVADALAELELHAGAPIGAEIIAALLPEDGPWNAP